MKKIITLFTALVLVASCFAVFSSAADAGRCATVRAANECGYGIWDLANEQIIVHVANDTVWNRVTTMRTFSGFVVASSAQDWGGTGIRKDPNAGDGQGCAQYAGLVVDGSVNASAKTFAFKVDPQNLSDIVSGANIDTGTNFPELIKNYGGTYAVRIDTNNGAGDDYLGYCLPVYDEAPDGLRMTSVDVGEDGKTLTIHFNSEVDNVWAPNGYDGNNTETGVNRNGSIYAGADRFTAIRIVNNMKDQDLQWDGETPAQWSASITDAWNWPSGYVAKITDSTFGASTFEEICALVDKGGKFEGCCVTFCIEESLNDIATNAGAAGGDGYIFSLFTNGAYNNKDYTLKATRVKEGSWDGAYVLMYNPNAGTADYTSFAVVGVVLAACAAAVVLSKKH